MPHPAQTASQLRRELQARAQALARQNAHLHDTTPGPSPALVFGRDDHGNHGNFHPATYPRITAHPDWSRRLLKVHTASKRSRARKDWQWMELDSATSSDALLMNILCHPGVFNGETLAPAVATLLNVDPATQPVFGLHPGVPFASGKLDRTEIDLTLASPGSPGLFLEAKLTESNFQNAPLARLTRYRDLEAVFDLDRLPTRIVLPQPLPANIDPDDPTVNLAARPTRTVISGYQLIRNVLAAYTADASFCVLLDARRHDLIGQWFAVLRAVHAPAFTTRLKLLTWQELTAVLPEELRLYLATKYGTAS